MRLKYLYHPGTTNIFSGYGLHLEHNIYVGFLIVDRPVKADIGWLMEIKETFGDIVLVPITSNEDRGILAQMYIAPSSLKYLRTIDNPKTDELVATLKPFLVNPPPVKFNLYWSDDRQLWQSTICRSL